MSNTNGLRGCVCVFKTIRKDKSMKLRGNQGGDKGGGGGDYEGRNNINTVLVHEILKKNQWKQKF